MANENKLLIEAHMNNIRNAEGVNEQGDYLKHYMRTWGELAETLQLEDIEKFKRLAKDKNSLWKAAPTLDTVFEYSIPFIYFNLILLTS
jgi:hypothetical protein